jgi:hypothetical protein
MWGKLAQYATILVFLEWLGRQGLFGLRGTGVLTWFWELLLVHL